MHLSNMHKPKISDNIDTDSEADWKCKTAENKGDMCPSAKNKKIHYFLLKENKTNGMNCMYSDVYKTFFEDWDQDFSSPFPLLYLFRTLPTPYKSN